MRQAIFRSAGELILEDRPDPTPNGQEVLIRVEACGVCGTDRQILAGSHPATPGVALGHEYAGTITAIGPDVVDLQVGDRVTVDPNVLCGRCRQCRSGRGQLCERPAPLGINRSGGFGEFSCVPEANAYRIPPTISSVEAALVEPLACCVHGIVRAGVELGDVVVILGAGTVGLLHAQLALARGAITVMAVDPVARRRTLATQLGCHSVVDPGETDVREAVLSFSHGRGADIVIEASGSAASAEVSMSLVTDGGTILLFGACPQEARIPIRPFHINEREISVRGSNLNPHTHQTAIDLLEHGRVSVGALVAQIVTLDELVSHLAGAGPSTGKLVVQPGPA